MLYKNIEGFSAPICSCPTGYTVGTATNSDKCYKTGYPTVFKDCKCSNAAITPTCSSGRRAVNNKCYNCDPSHLSTNASSNYNTPTLMTTGTYTNAIRCTLSGVSTATSYAAYEVANGLFCPTS